MYRNQSVSAHDFAMVPRADIPRATFKQDHAHKTTIDAGYLVPIYCQEMLPGDSFNLKATIFARLSTPLFPIMDNMHVSTFFFFVPARLVWANWKKFMGEQDNPGDSTSYVIPKTTSPAGGYAVNSLYDYMGLPTAGQVTAGQTITHNVLPLRAYNLIWNEWFRDENLQNSIPKNMGDGPDAHTDYVLKRRGKRHDYFTAALPWPQKGPAATIPIGTSAPITFPTNPSTWVAAGSANPVTTIGTAGSTTMQYNTNIVTAGQRFLAMPTDAYANLSTASAVTVNILRQSFQIQKLMERDARGGTRYTELVRAHFGVVSPDARLQRPEYIGGGRTPVNINPITQNSASGATGTTTPLGELGGMGTALALGHGFKYSSTEHGYVIGLMCVDADLTYQQGIHKMWTRDTKYDFYFPAFAHLGEQAVLNQEIYATGVDATDEAVFGYQERHAEYRYMPSRVSGLFRSTSAGTIDPWHLAQRFTSLPTLNSTFIESNPPLSRTLAVGAAANGKQFICDMVFNNIAARPMPMYGVPGMIDRF
ncbi:major capsid protein [Apis mellifera associated microvirus 14]|nr:major capsid protein [Apis mellifera associated microvirus 14]